MDFLLLLLPSVLRTSSFRAIESSAAAVAAWRQDSPLLSDIGTGEEEEEDQSG